MEPTSSAKTGCLLLAASAILMLPALWNGFPFIFFDSGDYLAVTMSGYRAVYRDPVYGFLITPLHGAYSLWGVAIGQSLLTAWVLYETCCAVLAGRRRAASYLGIIALLAIASSLPWFSAQIMPDIFGPLAVLLIYVLAVGELPLARRIPLALLLTLALASHLTFLPIGAGCLALLWLMRGLLHRRGAALRLREAVIAIALAPALVIGANSALGGPPVLSQTGHAFLLARLIQDGLAKQTLDRLCPDPTLSLCALKDRLPANANDFLWGDSEAFARIGGWLDSKPEADRIIAASLRLFPEDHLRNGLKLSGQQLTSYATGDGLESQAEPWGYIAEKFPGDLPSYTDARQQTGRLKLTTINRLHMPLAGAALLTLPLLLWFGWRQAHYRPWVGALLIAATLPANAVICAVLSNPVDRYQSRVIWLAVLAAGLAVAGLANGFRPEAKISG